jgi:hypothetical protein
VTFPLFVVAWHSGCSEYVPVLAVQVKSDVDLAFPFERRPPPVRGRAFPISWARASSQAHNLFGIIGYLQQQAGVELHVMAGPC